MDKKGGLNGFQPFDADFWEKNANNCRKFGKFAANLPKLGPAKWPVVIVACCDSGLTRSPLAEGGLWQVEKNP